MRLFVGIELPSSIRDAAALAAARLREQFAARHVRARVSWIDPANLHITLKFLGEVPEARLGEIEAAMREPLATPAFRLSLAGSGVFPTSGAPHALWLGLGLGSRELSALYDELAPRFERLGFPPEARGYNPHLTVARIKDIRRSEASIIRNVLGGRAEAIADWDNDGVTLFRSRLSPRGAQYEKLLRVPLG